MKIRVTVILMVLLFVTSIFASAYIEYFHASSEGENVVVTWKTREEEGVKKFVIERKTPQSSYVPIETVEPKGSYSYYEYIDEAAYKANDILFIYRLKIVDKNSDVSYTDERSVSPNISDIKRTWGSIKAMFR